MNCQEMIMALGVRDYWSRQEGNTPQATPYSGILCDITTKGYDAPFGKAEGGKSAPAG